MKIAGNILKEAREKSNITLENLSKNLKVNLDYILAIEEGKYSLTPGDPYTLGFIKSYANYFNLDEELIVKIYKDETKSNSKNERLILTKVSNENQYYYLKYGIVSLIFIILIFSFYNFFLSKAYQQNNFSLVPELDENMVAIIEEAELKQGIEALKKIEEDIRLVKEFSNEKNIEQSKENNYEEVKLANKLKKADVTINDNRDAIASFDKDKLNKINELKRFKFLGDTWIQISDHENNIILSKIMRKGEEYIFELDNIFYITTGNAGNIQLIMKDKTLGKLGKKGEVLNSFPLDVGNYNN